jgi:hypothetical protein
MDMSHLNLNKIEQIYLLIFELKIIFQKKRASDLYRTAQPSTLASFRTWGSSTGAGRIRLARTAKIRRFHNTCKTFIVDK